MSNAKKYPHYFKDVSTLDSIDVYRVADLWKITNNSQFHALKKILCAGGRGAKDVKQDIKEAIDALNRWREMLDEDARPAAAFEVSSGIGAPTQVEKRWVRLTNPQRHQSGMVYCFPFPHDPPLGMKWVLDNTALANIGAP